MHYGILQRLNQKMESSTLLSYSTVFDLSVLGIAMSANMKAELCVQTLDNAMASYPALHGAIIHSDRGAQYTSDLYRRAITQYGMEKMLSMMSMPYPTKALAATNRIR